MVTPESVLNLYRLCVFHTVGRSLSFSQAAEKLHTSQPNVSKHVRLLENELGIALFDRLGTRVALTDAGRIVYEYTERLFSVAGEMRRALDELQGLERGYLRLGASSTPGLYILPPLIASFWKHHPGLEITLELGNSREIVEKILNNLLDLGFVEAYEMEPGIQSQPFVADELVFVAAHESPLAKKSWVSAPDLEAETLIWREKGSGTREAMANLLTALRVTPRGFLELHGCEGVKRGVAAGLGISLVSRRSVEGELAQGTLAILEEPGLSVERVINAAAHKDARPSAAALAFMAHIRKTGPSFRSRVPHSTK